MTRIVKRVSLRRALLRSFPQIALTAVWMQQGKPNCCCWSVRIKARHCRRIVPVQVLEKKLLAIPARRMPVLRPGVSTRSGGFPLRTNNDTRLCSTASLLAYTHTHIHTHNHTHSQTFTPLSIHIRTYSHAYTYLYTHLHSHTFK